MCKDELENTSFQNRYAFQKKTKNRKYASKKTTYTFRGDKYRVNAKNKGLYTPILKYILELLYMAREKWRRVLVTRFDLHHKGIHTKDSAHISKFFKNLERKLERAYNTKALCVWVREVGSKEEGQHYHCALFMDGNKINQSYKLISISENTWSYHLSLPRYPYHYIDDSKIIQDAIYRLSYLAKVHTKGKRQLKAHDYGGSRLREYK